MEDATLHGCIPVIIMVPACLPARLPSCLPACLLAEVAFAVAPLPGACRSW